MSAWIPPENHPISLAQARQHMLGPLGSVLRDILAQSCAPLYWYRIEGGQRSVLNQGTVTFLRTPDRLLGVTAHHVIQQYIDDLTKGGRVVAQLFDAGIDDLPQRIVDSQKALDLATFALDDEILNRLGKPSRPLDNWPPRPPDENRGIFLAGYPGAERKATDRSHRIEFGLFTALVIARTVSDHQITWVPDREANVAVTDVPPPPERYELGGVSGGPLIAGFESDAGVFTYALAGIVTEHPNYKDSDFAIERVIASRADVIQRAGNIHAR